MALGLSVHGVQLTMGRHRFKELRHPLLADFDKYEVLFKPPFRKLTGPAVLTADYATVMNAAEVMHLICYNPSRYPAEAMAEFRQMLRGYDLFLVHAYEL